VNTPRIPLTCTLDEVALDERIRDWQGVVARATSRRVEDGRVVATYPNDAQLLARLRELIAAEAECCSFLRFRLDEMPDAIVTELRLPDDLPPSMRARVAELFGG
jgi:hypothetical protein